METRNKSVLSHNRANSILIIFKKSEREKQFITQYFTMMSVFGYLRLLVHNVPSGHSAVPPLSEKLPPFTSFRSQFTSH